MTLQPGNTVHVQPHPAIAHGVRVQDAAFDAELLIADPAGMWLSRRTDTGELAWLDPQMMDVTEAAVMEQALADLRSGVVESLVTLSPAELEAMEAEQPGELYPGRLFVEDRVVRDDEENILWWTN